MSAFTITARQILNTTDRVEALAAKLPVLCELAVVPGLINLIGQTILDVIERKPLHIIENDMADRATKIAVEMIPTGTLLSSIIGADKVAHEILSRLIKAQMMATKLDFKRTKEALVHNRISAPEPDSNEDKCNRQWQAFKGPCMKSISGPDFTPEPA